MAVKRLGSVKPLTNLQQRLQQIAQDQDREACEARLDASVAPTNA